MEKKHKKGKTLIPVLNATDVELYLIPASHNALLEVHEVHRLVVDEDEAHASLEGHDSVQTPRAILRQRTT